MTAVLHVTWLYLRHSVYPFETLGSDAIRARLNVTGESRKISRVMDGLPGYYDRLRMASDPSFLSTKEIIETNIIAFEDTLCLAAVSVVLDPRTAESLARDSSQCSFLRLLPFGDQQTAVRSAQHSHRRAISFRRQTPIAEGTTSFPFLSFCLSGRVGSLSALSDKRLTLVQEQ